MKNSVYRENLRLFGTDDFIKTPYVGKIYGYLGQTNIKNSVYRENLRLFGTDNFIKTPYIGKIYGYLGQTNLYKLRI